MQTTVTGHWADPNYIPPRCRKPRYTSFDVETTVTIDEVKPAEVVLAMSWEDSRNYTNKVYDIRGLLFRKAAPDLSRFDTPKHLFDHYSSEEEFRSAANDWARTVVICGDIVYERCPEPRYVVNTFGLGHNHVGTGLFVDTYDNENINPQFYFRADEFDKARAHAIAVAQRRGDTDDIPHFEQATPDITVHNPASVKLVTVEPSPEEIEDLRWEYRMAIRDLEASVTDGDPTAETELFNKVRALRKQITDKGFAPCKSEARPYENR